MPPGASLKHRIPLPHGHGSVSAASDDHGRGNPSFFLEWGSAVGDRLTWHTRSHCAVLRGSVEDRVHGFLRARIAETPESFIYEVGGIDDHLPLAVRISPSLKLSDWIGELNGSSAHYLNRHLRRRIPFAWQRGYGAVSFGKKDFPFVVDYIRRQKEHHRRAGTFDRLERISPGSTGPDHG